jgi:hypothetical protein
MKKGDGGIGEPAGQAPITYIGPEWVLAPEYSPMSANALQHPTRGLRSLPGFGVRRSCGVTIVQPRKHVSARFLLLIHKSPRVLDREAGAYRHASARR